MIKNKIHYIDIGARGNLTEPWISHEEELSIYGFEADLNELLQLKKKYPERNYFKFGLFSKQGKRKLFLTKEPSQSSMYPPNKDNSQFERQHWETRLTISETEVECSTIDNVLKDIHTLDAIKIDTQGGEYDILKGGIKTLSSEKPILFLETWCHPVYTDAPLMHEIL